MAKKKENLQIANFLNQSKENAVAAEKEAIENIQKQVVEQGRVEEVVTEQPKPVKKSKTQQIKDRRPFQKSIHFTKEIVDQLDTAKYFLSKTTGEKVSVEDIIFNITSAWLERNIADIEGGKLVKW